MAVEGRFWVLRFWEVEGGTKLLVYYFIVVHQSAELGREEDMACDMDRPTPPIPAKPMAQENYVIYHLYDQVPKHKQNQRLLLRPRSCKTKFQSSQTHQMHRHVPECGVLASMCAKAMCQNVGYQRAMCPKALQATSMLNIKPETESKHN